MKKVENIVFLSLVLDLFAFTIPLPLFPRIIEWYTVRESSDPRNLLPRTLGFVAWLRSLFYEPPSNPQRWDVVLLGGLMGSIFSLLQFLVSPRIGSLSDKYGRRRVLLITMVGNILSALMWLKSTTFATFMFSRIIGGLSEGNVQIATAILSDVTTPSQRSRALAQVGIAFAICFCIGPPIGAYFASRPLPASLHTMGVELNIYAVPAAVTIVLLVIETVFLLLFLPETRGLCLNIPRKPITDRSFPSPKERLSQRTSEKRLKLLEGLRRFHFFFLSVFSGMEFTLPFLTFDLFDWSNSQNGALIGSIGILSALLQGGYVRRATAKVGEGRMAKRGIFTCAIGLILLSLVPRFVTTSPATAIRLLQGAAVCLAFTSATVVSSLTSYASLQCDESIDEDTGKPTGHPQLAKGTALGLFRSSGQLGRAIGPLLGENNVSR
ncbi:major facilitator superfamily domain-containing protein [Pisolithus thermaeus]|nr:major facilitator superfamily domain-containing protein [Pisolithus thermaeus]